ncbi:hypothetical protein QFW77_18415 [Luteimonas sp. RD2P54]|uniref:Uncharacterized protein n=1 Tax=Luteimonas endophytica TaxID=3042023 RepID=A0ABT6JDY5_9GAMM|nr:hypothetical protein [Luteimonas endophytica]MDH5824944.1 hypothetical protein [Luteimonas endophytica]
MNPTPWLPTLTGHSFFKGSSIVAANPSRIPSAAFETLSIDHFSEAATAYFPLRRASDLVTWRQSPTSTRRAKENALLSRMRDFAKLRENWDGEGALAPSAEALETSSRVAALLGSLPEIETSPNPNGTISIFFEVLGDTCELEIGKTRFRFSKIPGPQGGELSGTGGDHEELMALMDSVVSAVAMQRQADRLSQAMECFICESDSMRSMRQDIHFSSEWSDDILIGAKISV